MSPKKSSTWYLLQGISEACKKLNGGRGAVGKTEVFGLKILSGIVKAMVGYRHNQ